MDFLKKKMKELLDDEKKEKDDKPSNSHSGAQGDTHRDATHGGPPFGPQNPYQQQPPQGFPQQDYPQPGGYPQQNYQQQQPYGQQHSSPVPPQGPPAPYGAPPPMPPGWLAQWDQSSQRWYYVDQSTGRSQWDPPAGAPPPQGPYAPPPPGSYDTRGAPDTHGTSGGYYQGAPAAYGGPGGHDERGLFGNTQGYDQGYGPGGSHGYDSQGDKEKKDKDKAKDKGHSTAKLAAVGLGGAAAGAWIGHEMTENSDDDGHTTNVTNNYGVAPAAAPAAYAPVPAYNEPPPVPTHDADGDSISSSDRESLEERRQELIEAQEEYQEKLEEAYDD